MPRLILTCAIILVCGLSHHVKADDEADQLRERIRAAYDETRTYQADVTYEASRKDGRWRLTQTFKVAYDRTGNQLLVDKPDSVVVCDGNRLYVRADSVPGRHLDAGAPQPLTFDRLLGKAPFLREPTLPDIAFLLGHDPLAFSTRLKVLAADPMDDQQRARLQFQTMRGEMIYYIDSSSNLVTGAKWRIGGQMRGPLEPEPTELSLEVNIVKRNDEFDEDLFVFDVSNSMPVGEFRDLFMAEAPAAQQMVDEDAPPIDLNTVEGDAFLLEKVEDEIVVLDFWATWCIPCHRALEVVQKLHEWARREGKPVKFVAINIEEESDDVAAFWEWKKLTMPTLLDSQGDVSRAYQVQPIPHTVIIHNGVIKQVHIGLVVDMEQRVQKEIEDLLTGEMAGEEANTAG